MRQSQNRSRYPSTCIARHALSGPEIAQHSPGVGDDRWRRSVKNPATFPAGRHEASLPQRAQVVRDERLPQPSDLHEIADGTFASRHEFEEPEARFVAQGAEAEGGNGARPISQVGHDVI